MKVSYFPGCTLNTTGKGFDNAVRASMAAVGLDLVELPEWNCCGATYPLIVDNMLELAAPAHVLVSARDQGLAGADTQARLTTACTTCYNVLKRTNRFIREHKDERERIAALIDTEYGGEVEVKDILHLLRDDVGFDAVRAAVQKPLTGLKVACYYGCMVLRPPAEVAYDDPDHPRSLDDLMAALGATPVGFPHGGECCGAYLAVKAPQVTREMVYTILGAAQTAGAEIVVTNCPLCQFNLDKQQVAMHHAHANFRTVPILYFSQLVGLALGLDPSGYGWERHYVGARPLLHRLGLIAEV